MAADRVGPTRAPIIRTFPAGGQWVLRARSVVDDLTKAAAEALHEEFEEPLSIPPPFLARMVDAGLLGRP